MSQVDLMSEGKSNPYPFLVSHGKGLSPSPSGSSPPAQGGTCETRSWQHNNHMTCISTARHKADWGSSCHFISIFMALYLCRFFHGLYGQMCHLANHLIMTNGVLNQHLQICWFKLYWHCYSERVLFGLSSCDLQFLLQRWCLIDFAVVESCSIITSNYMFPIPCQCLHVLFLILDCTIKRFPTLT